MTIVLNPSSRVAQWSEAFVELLPDEELRLWPDVGAPADIDYVIAWRMPRAALAEMINLRAILSLGAGTEQWQKPGMPEVTVVRLADPAMSDDMAGYALGWVIRHQRRFAECEELQARGEWKIPDSVAADDYRVGILGYGEIGSHIGRAFLRLGYAVNAWTRTRREVGNAQGYAGMGEFDAFLGASDAVINVLPSTPETEGLLDADRLGRLPSGSLFVNVGRGTVLAGDHQLLRALDDGPLGAAVLDVTTPEPLPSNSPLWTHPQVTIPAHLSGITRISTGARLIADNIVRMRAGQAPRPVLLPGRGY